MIRDRINLINGFSGQEKQSVPKRLSFQGPTILLDICYFDKYLAVLRHHYFRKEQDFTMTLVFMRTLIVDPKNSCEKEIFCYILIQICMFLLIPFRSSLAMNSGEE